MAYHENADVEFLGHVSELRQELVEFLLAIGKLAAAAVVHAEAGHDAVDDEETVFVARELRGEGVEELQLMLC